MPDIASLKSQFPELHSLSDDQIVNVMHSQYYPDRDIGEVAKALGVKPAAPAAPAVAPRGAMGTMRDVGISMLKGAIGLPEAAVGLADMATGGRVGKALEGVGYEPGRARAILDENLTEAQKAANAEFQGAEGFTGKLASAIENPSVIGQTIVESAPSMLGGAGLARGLIKVAPKMGAAIGAAAGEGVVGAGQAASQIRSQTPDRLLTPGQSMAAAASGVGTALFGALGGKVAQRLGIGDVDTMLAQASMNPVARKGVVRAALEGAVSEGVLEELPQSIQEQVWQNQALGKPLSEGVDEAAVLGLLSGGAMGGVAGPMSSGKAGDPIRDLKTGAPGTLSRAADAGLEQQARQVDAGISEGQLNAAMTAMEGQAADDQKGIKAAGRADKTGFAGQPTPTMGMAQAMGVAGNVGSTEEVSALADRIMGVKDALADPTTRDFIRQNLGDEAFNEATYYANQADRPGTIPDKTRENMLALAEAIVSRARLTPIQQPGALGTNVGPAPEALGAPQGVPAIGLDTTPTGAFRVDAAGNAAPEVNADVVSTRQSQAERETLGTQARRASAVPADPAPKAPAPPAAIGYDTSPTGRMVAGPDGVAVETNAERINRQQARSVQPGDRTAPSGNPFKNITAAKTEQRRNGGTVVEVNGGWVVRPQAETINGDTGETAQGTSGALGAGRIDLPSGASSTGNSPDVGGGTDAGGSGDTVGAGISGRDSRGAVAAQPGAGRDGGALKPPAFLRKTLPEMTEDELSQAGQFYGADHPRASKVKQEIDRRARKAKFEAKRKPKPEQANEQDAPKAPSTPTQTQPGQEGSDQAGTGTPGAGEAGRVSRAGSGADEAGGVKGEKIDNEWSAFTKESGTLGIPRAEMPQVKAEHRGAMVNFLKGRGIEHEQDEVEASSLKPSQAEFSPPKVEKAKGFTGGDRSILVSQDGHVIDGHHQWLAKLDAGEPVKVIRLKAPAAKVIEEVKAFPSAEQAPGADQPNTATQAAAYIDGEVLPASELLSYFDSEISGKGSGVKVPNPLFEVGSVDEATAKEIATYIDGYEGKQRRLRVSGRTLKHIHESRPAIARKIVEGLPDFFSKPDEVLPDHKHPGRRALLVKNQGGESSNSKNRSDVATVEVEIEVDVSDGFIDIVTVMTAPNRSLKAARELKKSWPEGQQRTEQAVNSPHPLPAEAVSPEADSPDARPTEASLAPDSPTGKSAPGGPRIIGRVGKTPNSSHDVELKANKDGTLTPWVEGYELLDFNSGDPVKVPADASDAEVLKAMRESGALSKGAKFYPTKDAAEGAAGFSRQAEDESFYRSQVDYEWAPPSVVNRVKQQVESLRTFWKNSPEVVVLASFADAPEAMQRLNDQQMESGAVGEPEGFFYKGKAYLLAPHMKSPEDVRRVLFHEALGHLGLRGVFGDGLNPILDQLWATRRKDVQAKADAYGLDTSKPNARRMAAEEVLAEMAQDRPEIGFVRRAVAIVKQWLRKHVPGFAKMRMTDAEITANFLMPAQRFIERGQGAEGQQLVPAFSRVDEAGSGFSRDTSAQAAADLNTKARNAFSDFVGSAGVQMDWLDKTLKTQYAKAERFPEFGKVFNKLQDYIEGVSSFANQAADKAPDILPKLDSFKDLMRDGPASLLRHGLSQEDIKALSAPVFEGTLNWTRDANGELVKTEDPASAGVVFSDAELRDKFGLSKKQIGHYRQFRATVDESLDQVVAADIIKLLGKKASASIKALANTADGRASLREALRQTFGNSDDKAMRTIWEDQIAPKYDHVASMKAKGYAPLSRFGKFFVHVVDKATGETVYFGMEETRIMSNRTARDMREEFGQGFDVTQGMMSQESYKLMSDVPVDAMEMFASAIGAEKSEVFQKYIALAKNNRSTLKRLLKRKGRAGYSLDAPRVLASFVTSNARASAAAVNMMDAKDLAQEIRAGDVKDEAIKLIEAVTEPQESGAAVRGMLFTNFIGGSIASAMVNMTQPVMMTVPYLSQFGGIGKASKRLVSAAGMAMSGKVGDAELEKALKRAESEGIVAPQEIHHLLKQATGSANFSPKVDAALQKLAFVWSTPFALAESFNRKATFIAAYQTAQAEGIANPYAFAQKAVTETQGLYNAGNKPNVARGTVGATVMTFKQYSIHYLEWLARMAKSGPEGKKAALWALALLVMAAGSDGLPFSEDLNDIIDTVGQSFGYDTNAKRWRHQVAADAFGEDAAEVLSRGLSASAGFPVDLSIRMGMGNLLPATDILKKSNTDTARSLAEIAGPGGALFTQYSDALKLMLSGEVGGAALKATPIALQNLGKAAKMLETGEFRDSKDRKVMDVDGADAAMKALSFQPAQIARESAKMSENRQSEVLAKTVEGEITDAWARAIVDGDAQAQEEARQRMLDWNQKNPDMPIRINRSQIASKAKKMRQTRAARYIKTVAPERRAAASQEIGS